MTSARGRTTLAALPTSSLIHCFNSTPIGADDRRPTGRRQITTTGMLGFVGLTACAWAVIIAAKEATMTYAGIVAMSLVRIASATPSRR
jgi:hypothetical protein